MSANSFDPVGAGIFILAGFVMVPLVLSMRRENQAARPKRKTPAKPPTPRTDLRRNPSERTGRPPGGNRR